jgi:undecaprenyl-diphosphatase
LTAQAKSPQKADMSRLTQPWPVKAGRSSWLIAAATCVGLLIALAFVDATVSRVGQGLPAPLATIFEWITQLGESGYILYSSLAVFLVAGGLALASPDELRRAGLQLVAGVSGFVFVGVGLPSLFTTIVKRLIGRTRPEFLDSVGPFNFRTLSWGTWYNQSFPSGHATTAFALCFVVSFLVPRAFPWMLALAVLIALSRIVVGAHYPTDVLGGAVVGILGAYLVRNIFAMRGWVFERRPDGAVGVRSFAPVGRLFSRR